MQAVFSLTHAQERGRFFWGTLLPEFRSGINSAHIKKRPVPGQWRCKIGLHKGQGRAGAAPVPQTKIITLLKKAREILEHMCTVSAYVGTRGKKTDSAFLRSSPSDAAAAAAATLQSFTVQSIFTMGFLFGKRTGGFFLHRTGMRLLASFLTVTATMGPATAKTRLCGRGALNGPLNDGRPAENFTPDN